jgi:hypothetical protein
VVVEHQEKRLIIEKCQWRSLTDHGIVGYTVGAIASQGATIVDNANVDLKAARTDLLSDPINTVLGVDFREE